MATLIIFRLYFIIIFISVVNCHLKKCTDSFTRVRKNSVNYKRRYCSGQLIFNDEFTDFNLNIWNHVITDLDPGNKLFQWYVNSRENSYVSNGILYIRPTVDLREQERIKKYFDYWHLPYNPYYARDIIHSARINTMYSMSFKYGRLEVRAKLPTGDWLWPAIWLMPRDNVYGNWPLSGEIDLVEAHGNRELILDGVNIGVNTVGQTLHFGMDRTNNAWRKAHFTKSRPNFGTEFHNYTMIWSPQGFEFYINKRLTGSINVPDDGFWEIGEFAKKNLTNPWEKQPPIAPFDQYFYIIMNVAVGGNSYYFPDNAINRNYTKPWNNLSPTAAQDFYNAKRLWMPTWPYLNANGEDSALQIDYIRLYAL